MQKECTLLKPRSASWRFFLISSIFKSLFCSFSELKCEVEDAVLSLVDAQTPRIHCPGQDFLPRRAVVQTSRIQGYHSSNVCFVCSSFFFLFFIDTCPRRLQKLHYSRVLFLLYREHALQSGHHAAANTENKDAADSNTSHSECF